MVYTGIFCTEAEADFRAGENVDLTGWTEANKNLLAFQIEAFINVETQYNWSDAYTGLNVDFKHILSTAAACYMGIFGITYNMAGYTSRVEAEDMLSMNWAMFNICLDTLRDQAKRKFMQ